MNNVQFVFTFNPIHVKMLNMSINTKLKNCIGLQELYDTSDLVPNKTGTWNVEGWSPFT